MVQYLVAELSPQSIRVRVRVSSRRFIASTS